METTESNKLIAEFMGFSLKDGVYTAFRTIDDYSAHIPFVIDGDGNTEYDELKFHTSWDWLMPVVEKIDSLRNDWPDATEDILYTPIRTPIVEVYELVITLIQWYNTQTKPIN